MFYIGQLVVCVDDNFGTDSSEWLNHVPKRGVVYTVREVLFGPDFSRGGSCWGIKLREIVNPLSPSGKEAGFAGWRFKPYEEACSNKIEADQVVPNR
jgi:hypothetical protein